MKINNLLTHISDKNDLVYLKQPLFDVNIRLFRISSAYRHLIETCCNHIRLAALEKYEDYKAPHGMSGANVAIPFNIIGIVRERGTNKQYCEIMINPKILKTFGPIIETKSNCGSIRLKEPISIKRNSVIDLSWVDETGYPRTKSNIGVAEQSLTIQHEVDHNIGILITDL
jgi:peptide deformylase